MTPQEHYEDGSQALAQVVNKDMPADHIIAASNVAIAHFLAGLLKFAEQAEVERMAQPKAAS